MKNRKRQRDNRRIKQREERIDKRNNYGVKDLTAYNAVRQIRTNGKAPFAELTAKAALGNGAVFLRKDLQKRR